MSYSSIKGGTRTPSVSLPHKNSTRNCRNRLHRAYSNDSSEFVGGGVIIMAFIPTGPVFGGYGSEDFNIR